MFLRAFCQLSRVATTHRQSPLSRSLYRQAQREPLTNAVPAYPMTSPEESRHRFQCPSKKGTHSSTTKNCFVPEGITHHARSPRVPAEKARGNARARLSDRALLHSHGVVAAADRKRSGMHSLFLSCLPVASVLRHDGAAAQSLSTGESRFSRSRFLSDPAFVLQSGGRSAWNHPAATCRELH